MKIEVNRICNGCNKEFALLLSPYPELISAFQSCPYCGVRNDIWIKVKIINQPH